MCWLNLELSSILYFLYLLIQHKVLRLTMDKQRTLDRIDLTILDTLQKDGRISNVDLAKKVNLSASPCLDRVKRLEQEGYIERYGAFLTAAKLQYGMSAFIQNTLERTTSDVFNTFRDELIKIKEVAECHMVAGGFDYLVKLRFKDMAGYRDILGVIVDLPGVSQTHTYIVMEQVKKDQGIPLIE